MIRKHLDLIDRTELLKQRKEFYHYRIIEAEPCVDAVEVVRCRDCEFYRQRTLSSFNPNAAFMCCRSANVKVPPDGFCSFGRPRKEKENETV